MILKELEIGSIKIWAKLGRIHGPKPPMPLLKLRYRDRLL